jgi:hypothetical protein
MELMFYKHIYINFRLFWHEKGIIISCIHSNQLNLSKKKQVKRRTRKWGESRKLGRTSISSSPSANFAGIGRRLSDTCAFSVFISN